MGSRGFQGVNEFDINSVSLNLIPFLYKVFFSQKIAFYVKKCKENKGVCFIRSPIYILCACVMFNIHKLCLNRHIARNKSEYFVNKYPNIMHSSPIYFVFEYFQPALLSLLLLMLLCNLALTGQTVRERI